MDRAVEETAATYLEEFTVDGVLEEDPEEQAEQSSGTIDLEASLRDADASPVVSLVDRILLQAMSVGASDIHVEPQQKGLRLRYRQDGVHQQYIEPLPGRLIPAVTSRFKILADLDIAERRQAQDGRIRRRYRDRLMLKVPLFGELIMMTATAQFCRIFSSLTRAGVPILMSLEISSQTAGNSIISDAILESRALVQEGVLLSTALIRQKVLPDMALNMLSIGEETGEMDKMLSKVADFYEDEVSAMVKALTSMLEPAMIVVVGGIVGSILLAMYLPMFTVFDKIQWGFSKPPALPPNRHSSRPES